MGYTYQKELEFTASVLRSMRLPVYFLHPDDNLKQLDTGLRKLLGLELDYVTALQFARQWSGSRSIYKIMDQFMCHYIFLHLPEANPPTAMVIGPYLTQDPSPEMILEQTERLGLPMHTVVTQGDYYAALPVFHDPSGIMALMSTLGSVLWAGSSFDMVDVNFEQYIDMPTSSEADSPIEQTDILQRMQQLEIRYAHEDQLMEIVSKGLTNQAELLMASVSRMNYQQRLPDQLRNMKNYCIICNTLMRKAAQHGGVHPLHLDRMSTHYAHVIENTSSIEACSHLIGALIRDYCRLVRSHSYHQYSLLVQKTLTYIDANLSGDLRLSTLADMLKVAPGYLSGRFHRETGQTLSSHIAAQRMKAALHLLHSTHLQVQSIAQLCGFSDPGYFTRLFKRTYGVTPADYRRDMGPSPEQSHA